MASLVDLENDEGKLIAFHRMLGEELEKLKEIRTPEVKSKLIKKMQIQMFETALSLSFKSIQEN